MTPLPFPLNELAPAEQDALAGHLVDASYAPGDVIVESDTPGDWCLFIDRGLVRLDLPTAHIDTDVTLGYLEAGDLLGEMSLVDTTPRSARAIAEDAVEGRVLTAHALERLATADPTLGAHVMQVLAADLARKLRRATDRLADVLVLDAHDPEVDDLVARGNAAQAALADADDAAIEAALDDLADEFAAAAGRLAQLTVDLTHLGNVTDKTIKNTFAARAVRQHTAAGIGHGVLAEADGVTQLVAPVGTVFAIIPVTNPVATAMFKVLSALKTRNAIILSMHRVCLDLAEEIGRIAHAVLDRHGLPADAVLWVRTRTSRVKTNLFMRHPGVALVLATGGPGMVHAAYSSGTPALGVGSGNAPAWIAPDADLTAAAHAVVASKSFDNGLICGAEHNLLVDAAIQDPFVDALEAAGAAVLTPDEGERLLGAILTEDGIGYRPEVQGQSAALIASMLGIERPFDIRLIVFHADPDLDSPITAEKMAPLLSLFTVEGDDQAIGLATALLHRMGTGHTAIVHTTSDERVTRFAAAVPASRILVNGPGSQGVCGLTTNLHPSLTLGCGTFGGNSVSDNVTFEHLRNVKRVARVVDHDPALIGQPM